MPSFFGDFYLFRVSNCRKLSSRNGLHCIVTLLQLGSIEVIYAIPEGLLWNWRITGAKEEPQLTKIKKIPYLLTFNKHLKASSDTFFKNLYFFSRKLLRIPKIYIYIHSKGVKGI